jgi:hypothetical protein
VSLRVATDRDEATASFGDAPPLGRERPNTDVELSLSKPCLGDNRMKTLHALWNDEAGMVVSAELVLVLTITVLALVVGLSEVAVAINTELNDLSNAFGSLNQSYSFTGFHAEDNYKTKSIVYGSSFRDGVDDCDLNSTCDLVCGNTAMEGND